MSTVVIKSEKRSEILKIRCSKKTIILWREQLLKYKNAGLDAEDLLLDALRLLREQGYPRVAPVY